jgi:AmmeMemoRadiSam system protein B
MNKRYLLIAICLFGVGFAGGVLLIPREKAPENFHYSAFTKKDFFEEAFSRAEKKELPKISGASGVIVNHHLLAGDLIAQALLAVQSQKPDTVVLLSPNHFGSGRSRVIASKYDWQTPYGILPADKKIIDKLLERNTLTVEENPFEKEHGVFNITGFIKKVFPNSKVIPIIIKNDLKTTGMITLAKALTETLPKNSLIILSADFTHETTSKIADQNDQKSLSIIEKLDFDRLNEITIDSQPAMGVFLKLMELSEAKSWHFFANTNAAKIIGKEPLEGVTSYITGAFSR